MIPHHALSSDVSRTNQVIYEVGGVKLVGLPNVIPGILGSALAIFLGFRNSAAYARWGEAAQLWAGLVNQSSVFARLVVTFSDSHSHTPSYDVNRVKLFQREMVLRHVAWVHALRLQLRDQWTPSEWGVLQAFLSEAEFHQITGKKINVPTSLLLLQGTRIYDGMRDGTLQGFDSFQLENCLAQFSNGQAQCERIKAIPIPRQYTYFTRMVVWVFIVVLPFSAVTTFDGTSRAWVTIPVTILLSFVFGIIERTGAVNEEPFQNRITDVPLTAMCRDVERNLREIIGDDPQEAIPPKLLPVHGYLW